MKFMPIVQKLTLSAAAFLLSWSFLEAASAPSLILSLAYSLACLALNEEIMVSIHNNFIIYGLKLTLSSAALFPSWNLLAAASAPSCNLSLA